MSPGVLTTEEPGFSVSLMDEPADKKLNFGAVITGLDLQNISGLSPASSRRSKPAA